jgi:hypothetical protein
MGVRGQNDAEADMLLAEASSAICVQRFDGSRNSAIHTTYRISLRSSSLREPRYPLLRVVFVSGAIEIAPRTSDFVFEAVHLSSRGWDDEQRCGGIHQPCHQGVFHTRRSLARTDLAAEAIKQQQARLAYGIKGSHCGLIDSMILPQVHLRKPCYDFSFL